MYAHKKDLNNTGAKCIHFFFQTHVEYRKIKSKIWYSQRKK